MLTNVILDQAAACIGHAADELQQDNLDMAELYTHAAGSLLNISSARLQKSIEEKGDRNIDTLTKPN